MLNSISSRTPCCKVPHTSRASQNVSSKSSASHAPRREGRRGAPSIKQHKVRSERYSGHRLTCLLDCIRMCVSALVVCNDQRANNLPGDNIAEPCFFRKHAGTNHPISSGLAKILASSSMSRSVCTRGIESSRDRRGPLSRLGMLLLLALVLLPALS